jgi:hypothetical protein
MRSGLSAEKTRGLWGPLPSSHAIIGIEVRTTTAFVDGKTTERRTGEAGEIAYTSLNRATEVNEGGIIDG